MLAPEPRTYAAPSISRGPRPVAPKPVRPAAAPRTISNPAGINFAAMLGGDQQLQSALSGYNAQGKIATSDLGLARSRMLAQFGSIPNSLGFDVDETTRGLASAATSGGVSTVARLQDAYRRKQSSDVGDLAARGIVRSGALGQHMNQNLKDYNIASYDAEQGLLDQLNQMYRGYSDQQSNLMNQGVDQTNLAMQRIIDQINSGLLANPSGSSAPSYPTYQEPRSLIVPNRGRAAY